MKQTDILKMTYENFYNGSQNGIDVSVKPTYGFDEKKIVEKNPILEQSLPNAGVHSYAYNQNQSIPLTQEQIQKLNFQRELSIMRIKEDMAHQQIRINAHIVHKQINQSFDTSSKAPSDVHIDGNGIVTASNTSVNDYELIERFIEDKGLVREINQNSRDGYAIFKRKINLNRYVMIDKGNLKVDFDEFVYNRLGKNATASAVDRLFNILIKKIKTVEDLISEKKIIRLPRYTVALKNGFYDIKDNTFQSKDEISEKIFNTTSLRVNYLEDDIKPKIFNKLLKGMFGDDERKVELLYEYMGAIFSGIKIIKKIFVMQGVSNGGKSRLSRIIKKCFYDADVISLGKLTDLTDTINVEKAMLVIIDELPDKKINPSQVSQLKKLSNGENQIKIIATTNHAIVTGVTGEERLIDPALLNRLAVIPFQKVMDNNDADVAAYEDLYMEDELEAIVNQALKKFHKVIEQSENIANLKFSEDYPLNSCVEAKIKPNTESQFNAQHLQEVLNEQSNLITTNAFENALEQLLEVTTEINPEMTTEFVMQTLNKLSPEIISDDSQSLGKKLRNYYGDQLKNGRKNGKMCYNLKLRNLVQRA